MADIFGRLPQHYPHYVALQQAGVYDAQMRAITEATGRPSHDFNALGAGVPSSLSRAEPNAQALGFVMNNLIAIQAVPDAILYRSLRIMDLVPFNMSIEEGATEYGVVVEDYVGEGAYVTNDGQDVPRVNVAQRLVPHGLDLGGIDAPWTIEDIRRAMMIGTPLQTRLLEAATMQSMKHIERVGLRGDLPRGYTGLTNLATGAGNVTRSDAAKTWAASTGEEIRAFVTAAIGKIIEDTDEVFGSGQIQSGLCIYLPVAQFNKITSDPIGDNASRTVWAYIKMYNPWTERTGMAVELKSVIELKGAGTGATDRMIVAVKDNRVMEMGVPFLPRVLNVWNKGREVIAQLEYKFGSLFVKRPTTILYYDGI